MIHTFEYECPTCHSTYTTIWDTERVGIVPRPGDIPDKIPCGWRGCIDYRILKTKE